MFFRLGVRARRRACLAAGLDWDEGFVVDASLMQADANNSARSQVVPKFDINWMAANPVGRSQFL
jgi:hypothetical protein